MTLKKWRPLWSYDVEKTERWLSKMSTEGNRLIGVNRMTRMFSFDRAAAETLQYQVVFDKSRSALPRMVEEAGWEVAHSVSKWKFMKNDSTDISVFPTREGLMKRNRIHFYVLTGFAFFYVIPLIMMLITLFMILKGVATAEPSPFWSVTVVFFLQIVMVMGLAVFINQKMKVFEKKFSGGAVDVEESYGDTFMKWRFGWMYAPDSLENWLSEMATEGNHLVRIDKSGLRFVFEKGVPKCMSYVFDYQLKTAPSYFDVHKSAGWKLKYTTPYSFTKYSVWAQPYEEGTTKPRFTFDANEKKAQVRKVVFSAVVFFVYIVAIVLYVLSLNFSIYQENGWTLFGKILVGGLVIALVSPLSFLVRTVKYAVRMHRL